MRINKERFNDRIREELKGAGIEHWTLLVEYEGEEVSHIVIVPVKIGKKVPEGGQDEPRDI